MASKLHLPAGNLAHLPLCGRQLDNLRSSATQDSSRAAIAQTIGEFVAAFQRGEACRHCARAVGMLSRITRGPRFEGDSEEDGE